MKRKSIIILFNKRGWNVRTPRQFLILNIYIFFFITCTFFFLKTVVTHQVNHSGERHGTSGHSTLRLRTVCSHRKLLLLLLSLTRNTYRTKDITSSCSIHINQELCRGICYILVCSQELHFLVY